MGGKEILLKAVAQAILVFAMSVFQIPKGVCKAMMHTISQLWWGDDENSNKMHWMAWYVTPKNKGGMGFRDFHSFNLAMLAKQASTLITNPESLCAQVLRAKYYPQGDILNVGPKAGCSFTWQSILAGLTTLNEIIFGEWAMGLVSKFGMTLGFLLVRHGVSSQLEEVQFIQ
jgi:hypothetical protein